MVLLWVARGEKERRGVRGGGDVATAVINRPGEEIIELLMPPDGVLKGLNRSSRVAHERDDQSTFDMLSAAALLQRFEALLPPRNTLQTKHPHHEIYTF